MVQILHTSDVHLGKPFHGFGKFGRVLRQQVRDSFFQLLRQAPGNVQLVLIAGDLFESNNPDPRDIRQFLEVIRQIAPLAVCVLPGTHDRFNNESVFRRPEFVERPANLFLFDQDGPQCFPFPELSIAVHGRANLTNRGGEPPLKGLRPYSAARFNVAVAHASIPLPQFSADRDDDYLVTLEDAQASGMDYVALGHWHRFGECFSGDRPRVFYSGCPERIDFRGSEARGSWARVTLREEGVMVAEVPSGHYCWRELQIGIEGIGDEEIVRRELEAWASEFTVCRLDVSGRPAPGYRVPVENLEEEFDGHYAYLEIRDETARDVPLEALAGRFTPNTVGDFFCRP